MIEESRVPARLPHQVEQLCVLALPGCLRHYLLVQSFLEASVELLDLLISTSLLFQLSLPVVSFILTLFEQGLELSRSESLLIKSSCQTAFASHELLDGLPQACYRALRCLALFLQSCVIPFCQCCRFRHSLEILQLPLIFVVPSFSLNRLLPQHRHVAPHLGRFVLDNIELLPVLLHCPLHPRPFHLLLLSFFSLKPDRLLVLLLAPRSLVLEGPPQPFDFFSEASLLELCPP